MSGNMEQILLGNDSDIEESDADFSECFGNSNAAVVFPSTAAAATLHPATRTAVTFSSPCSSVKKCRNKSREAAPTSVVAGGCHPDPCQPDRRLARTELPSRSSARPRSPMLQQPATCILERLEKENPEAFQKIAVVIQRCIAMRQEPGYEDLAACIRTQIKEVLMQMNADHAARRTAHQQAEALKQPQPALQQQANKTPDPASAVPAEVPPATAQVHASPEQAATKGAPSQGSTDQSAEKHKTAAADKAKNTKKSRDSAKVDHEQTHDPIMWEGFRTYMIKEQRSLLYHGAAPVSKAGRNEAFSLRDLAESKMVSVRSSRVSEKALFLARQRQNLDVKRLWYQQSVGHNTRPALAVHMGSDVERQFAQADGKAAQTCQRMEEAFERHSGIPSLNNDYFSYENLANATCMGDLSLMFKSTRGRQAAESQAKRCFEMICGEGSGEYPFGRVSKQMKVEVQ